MVSSAPRARAPPSDDESAPDVRESPLEVRPPTPDSLCIETPLASLDEPITPTRKFFVRNHFATPTVDVERWRLRVEGEVDRPLHLRYDELRGLPHTEVEALLECAGNSRSSVRPPPEGVRWRNGAVGAARWTGVPLHVLLDRAGVRPGAVEVLFEGLDTGTEPGVAKELRFAMSIPVAKAGHRDTLVVTEMNGRPLTARHGFPARVVVPGWYGMASVKWLDRVVVLREPFRGHFRSRAYAFIPEGEAAEAVHRPVTEVRVKSLTTWPKEGAVLVVGAHRLRGVAWSGAARIVRVEVSLGGLSDPHEETSWHAATFSPSEAEAPWSWTHWEYEGEFTRPGFYVIRVRATDERGNVQPVEAKWNYRGLANNSIHQVPVEVRRG